jgi:hypothetical protein
MNVIVHYYISIEVAMQVRFPVQGMYRGSGMHELPEFFNGCR